DWSG
ncbi:transketolase, partial [Vibrio cholerae HC-59A1]